MISTLLEPSQVAEAKRLIEGAHKIVLFTHMAPDGDAMGSSLAMYHWIVEVRKTKDRPSGTESLLEEELSVAVVTPNAFPEFLAWMPGADAVKVYEPNPAAVDPVIAGADLHICLDFNDPKRIGPVGDKLLQNPCPKILIDHHLNPLDFASVKFSYPEASSTCELVYRLIADIQNGQPCLTNEIATAIYTGLMTDTGNFSYNSNNPDLYEMIAELLRAGVNKDEIYNAVFNQWTPDRLRLTGYCLYRKMRLFPEHHLAVIALSHAELKEFRFKSGDTEGIVNMPLQISDVYYSILLREEPAKPGTPNPRIKFSFRSQGDRPVNVFASEVFRGGGHMNASGGDFFGSLAAAMNKLLQHYPKYLKNE